MAETIIQVFRIAGYNTITNELVGYKSCDGDWTEDLNEIQYYNSYEAAGNNIDAQDEESTGIREEIESVMMSLEEFMTEH